MQGGGTVRSTTQQRKISIAYYIAEFFKGFSEKKPNANIYKFKNQKQCKIIREFCTLELTLLAH